MLPVCKDLADRNPVTGQTIRVQATRVSTACLSKSGLTLITKLFLTFWVLVSTWQIVYNEEALCGSKVALPRCVQEEQGS